MTRRLALLLAALLLGLCLGAPVADAAPRALRVAWVRCFGVKDFACAGKSIVQTGGAMRLAVVSASPQARVLWPDKTGRVHTLRPWWRTAKRIWVRVPSWAATGTVRVLDRGGRSNGRRVTVQRSIGALGDAKAFGGDGMWIWQVPMTQGGDPAAIAARARAAGVETVYVKSGDGRSLWSQFSSSLVAKLKASGLRVCAWQFVYGTDPEGEAAVSAAAVRRGADCFVIDAEAEYEGRYAQAQRYMRALRADVGADYPLALASFPYADYHPTFPYSVFLGKDGAQANLPQMYWKDIGTTTDRAFQQTYATNLPYDRPIFPLGQLYGDPSAAELQRFRALAEGYGAGGASWWSWQEATDAEWASAVGQPAPAPAPVTPAWISLGPGSRGDLVVRAQELLLGGGASLPVTGNYGALTAKAVRALQTREGLPRTGVVDEATWRKLLKAKPKPTDWVGAATPRATARTASAG